MAPQLDDLAAEVAALTELMAAGQERWKGVEMAVGRAAQELLQLAGKEPMLQQSLYSLLPKLQDALEGGKTLIKDGTAHSDAGQQALDALKRSLAGS